MRTFAGGLATADVALLFYAGHGLQVGAQNYLVPADAKLERERDLEFEAIRLDFLLRQMEIDRDGKTSIVILDACRDNPLSRNLARTMGTRSTNIGRGLAAASTGLGTFIAYSTQPGNVALDGTGRNSPFTSALVKHMGVKGRTLPATMIEVRKDVVAATNGRQVPWDHSALTGEFQFIPGAPTTVAAAIAGSKPSVDVAAMQERLARLEQDAKARETAAAAIAKPASPTNPPAPSVATTAPPIQPKPTVPKVSPNFEEIDNVGLMGVEIRSFKAPSPIACREACNKETGCVGFQHGRKIPMMGVCELFSRIDARREDAQWRSGLRRDPTAGSASTDGRNLLLQLKQPNRTERGYAFFDGVDVNGDVIKSSAADSDMGCSNACKNTPGCVAAHYLATRSRNERCTVLRGIGGASPGGSGTAILKTP